MSVSNQSNLDRSNRSSSESVKLQEPFAIPHLDPPFPALQPPVSYNYPSPFIALNQPINFLPPTAPSTSYSPSSSQYTNVPHNIQQLMNNIFNMINLQTNLLKQAEIKNKKNYKLAKKLHCEIKERKWEFDFSELSSYNEEDYQEEHNQQIQKQEHINDPQEQEANSNQGNEKPKNNTFHQQISKQDLKAILYGTSPNFKYKIIIDSSIPFANWMYKERNFAFKLQLVDSEGNKVRNINRIPISLALYTIDNPPKYLQLNTLGHKMIKGNLENDMIHGSCLFDKIQIREVTSHYRKNMLFFVAYAKAPSIGTEEAEGADYVNYKEVQPLIIDGFVVRAKMLKAWRTDKREQGNEEKMQEKEKMRQIRKEKREKQDTEKEEERRRKKKAKQVVKACKKNWEPSGSESSDSESEEAEEDESEQIEEEIEKEKEKEKEQ